MIPLVIDNPYRVLGVYSNSPKKDVLSNLNKMKAFMKVGKSMSFPLDLPSILPATIRSEEALQKAQSAIELPMDQIKYSMFWFMKVTPFDDIAFNHLQSGNIVSAIDIWSKKESVSSLLNLIVCSFIENRCSDIAIYADKLFQNYSNEFCQIVNETVKLSQSQLIDLFIESISISDSFDITSLSNVSGTSETWNTTVGKRLVQPIIDEITVAIEDAKQAKGATANYNAGVKLMNGTKDSLAKLKILLGASDMQYQMIADKLAQAILQSGINYFNDSDDDDAPEKALILQNYALSIAVGQMAKERCSENVDILKKIIANRPPMEIAAEVKLIQTELEKYCQLPDLIKHAITLLNNTKPHLNVIKQKVGATNPYYLKLSTQVIGNALHNVIEEVNAAQEDNSVSLETRRRNAQSKFEYVKSILKEAWRAIRIMDAFDMESSFKSSRYTPNRNTLVSLCQQCGIATSVGEAIGNGLDKANNATGGCLETILGYIIWGLVIMAFAGICSLF